MKRFGFAFAMACLLVVSFGVGGQCGWRAARQPVNAAPSDVVAGFPPDAKTRHFCRHSNGISVYFYGATRMEWTNRADRVGQRETFGAEIVPQTPDDEDLLNQFLFR